MTQSPTHSKRTEITHWGSLCFAFLLLFSLALFLRRSDVATDCMRQGLALCARAVVPSLFPFMILSELLVTSGAGELLTAPISPLLGKLLGLSRAGCCAVVLGLICGFPVGARCAILAYEKGAISRTDCERVMACSSLPSSAFLISTVGTALWRDAKFGTILYLSAVISALLSGILLYVLQKRPLKESKSATTRPPIKLHFEAKMFSTAVRNATMSTLLICAYVVFFSTLTGAIGLILGRFGANEITHAILSVFLELSGGVSAAAELTNHYLAVILTAIAVGWSGLSIHCQMLSLCDGHRLSLRSYFIAKLVQAVVCPCLILISLIW